MTTPTPETTIESDPNVPLVRIVREFAAPPALVYRAHIDPDVFPLWIGPDGMRTELVTWEPRSGGSYRYVQRNDDGAYEFFGSFHELRPNELIVQTFTYVDWPDGVALEKLVLDDLGNGRTRLTSTSLVDSFETRDAFVASGMEDGVTQGYRRLDEYLAR